MAGLALTQAELVPAALDIFPAANGAPRAARQVSLSRKPLPSVVLCRVRVQCSSSDGKPLPRGASTSRLNSLLPSSMISWALSAVSIKKNVEAEKRSDDFVPKAGGGDGAGNGGDDGQGGGGGGGGDEGGDGDSDASKNKAEALAALAVAGKTLQNLPADLADAVLKGKVTGAIIERWNGVQASKLLGPLLRFQGFKERLLADDLFMTKVAIECGVGLFTKTAAEYSKRQDKFFQEIDFVIADVIMALIADFMLTWLPAPTVGLAGKASSAAGPIAKFLAGCPDNAFQVAIRGTSYSTLQRVGAIIRNGAKLVVVGTSASLMGTLATNGLMQLRKKVGTEPAAEGAGSHETEVPILGTSLAYGVYMGVSSNLRYQVLAGVVEQRFLEPMLEKNKLALSVLSFIARTGNTFLGSLLWVDYARLVGVQ